MNVAWKEQRLGAVLQLQYGKPLDERERNPNGLYPVYGANGEKNRSDRFYFDRPSIIVGRKGSAGELNLTEQRFWPLDVTYFTTFDDTRHDLRFLYYLLTTLDLPALAKGVKPGINREEIYSQTVRIPSLSEQRRIAGILDKAFAAITTAKANTERNHENARALMQSHIDEVFGQAHQGWTSCCLSDCLGLITYGFTNPMPTTEEGPLMITAKNVIGGVIDYRNARHTSRVAFDERLTEKSRPKIGDVLLTKDGTLGRLAVVDRPDLCINQSVALLRPNGRMAAHFMKYLLSSRCYQDRMVGDADGTTIKHIYITRVDKMVVIFPPIEEQQRIAAMLDGFATRSSQLVRLSEEKLAAIDELERSLLHQALNGAL